MTKETAGSLINKRSLPDNLPNNQPRNLYTKKNKFMEHFQVYKSKNEGVVQNHVKSYIYQWSSRQ